MHEKMSKMDADWRTYSSSPHSEPQQAVPLRTALGFFFPFVFLSQLNASRVTNFRQAGSTGGFRKESRQVTCFVCIPFSVQNLSLAPSLHHPSWVLHSCYFRGFGGFVTFTQEVPLPSLTSIITTINSRQRRHLSFGVWVEPNIIS